MTLRGKLFGNAGIYLCANILNAGIPFLLLPVLTRVLTPADYGTIAMFGIVLSIFGAFTGLSIHGAIGVRFFQLEPEALSEYVGTCLGILVISTAILFVVMIFLGPALSDISGIPLLWILAAVLLSGFQIISSIRLALWQVSGKAKHYGAFQISQSLLNAAGSLILILGIQMAWEGRLLGQSIAILLYGVIAYWWLLGDRFVRWPKAWRNHSQDALKFGVPLIPHVLGGLLIVAADRFIIVELIDLAQAGIYMVALQVGQALGLVAESFNKAYAPWLMKQLTNSTQRLKIQIVRGTYLYFISILLASTVFGYLAPGFIFIFVGESFRTAGEFILFIAIGYAFNGCYYMVTNYIFFASKTKSLAVVTLCSGILNVVLMVICIRAYGTIGAAYAFMLTNAASFLGTWWVAHNAYPMPWLSSLRLSPKNH